MSNNKTDKQAQEYDELVSEIARQAGVEEEYDVPNWHRESAFEEHSIHAKASVTSSPWWHWQSTGGLVMAISFTAVTLLGVFLIKSEPLDQQAVAQLIKEQVAAQVNVEVNRKLRDFATEQQLILANYKAELSERQERSNMQLAGYVLSSTRSERKEDMSDFIGYINAQRKDEQLAQKIKFQQLEQAIDFRKANFEASTQ